MTKKQKQSDDAIISMIKDKNLAKNELSVSNGFARIRFDVSKLTKVQCSKIFKAKRLLEEANIFFDSGIGYNFIDWEIDWSLQGAVIEIRPLACINCLTQVTNAIWVRSVKDNKSELHPFCSNKCIKQFFEKSKVKKYKIKEVV